jgi:hypothetical protein
MRADSQIRLPNPTRVLSVSGRQIAAQGRQGTLAAERAIVADIVLAGPDAAGVGDRPRNDIGSTRSPRVG